MLPVQEALSGIFGTISLISWTSVFAPQLIENYRQQSAEALSLPFIIIWFVGDALNLIGAVWAGLVPVMIVNGVSYCTTDFIMVIQCLYYKSRYSIKQDVGLAKRRRSIVNDDQIADEGLCDITPLIASRELDGAGIDLTSTHAANKPLGTRVSRQKALKGHRVCNWSIIRLVLAIIVLGVAGWLLAYRVGLWEPSSPETPHKSHARAFGAQVMGYSSALVSLTARLPQIFKNMREQSCVGLSPSFVVLSLLGNITIGGSVLVHSFQRDYIIISLPWLVGSFLPALQDILLLFQIQMYNSESESEVVVSTID